MFSKQQSLARHELEKVLTFLSEFFLRYLFYMVIQAYTALVKLVKDLYPRKKLIEWALRANRWLAREKCDLTHNTTIFWMPFSLFSYTNNVSCKLKWEFHKKKTIYYAPTSFPSVWWSEILIKESELIF